MQSVNFIEGLEGIEEKNEWRKMNNTCMCQSIRYKMN